MTAFLQHTDHSEMVNIFHTETYSDLFETTRDQELGGDSPSIFWGKVEVSSINENNDDIV